MHAIEPTSTNELTVDDYIKINCVQPFRVIFRIKFIAVCFGFLGRSVHWSPQSDFHEAVRTGRLVTFRPDASHVQRIKQSSIDHINSHALPSPAKIFHSGTNEQVNRSQRFNFISLLLRATPPSRSNFYEQTRELCRCHFASTKRF